MHARILASLLLLGVVTALAVRKNDCPVETIDEVRTGTGYFWQPHYAPGGPVDGPGDGNGNGPANYTGACGEPFDLSAMVACVRPGWKELCGQEVVVWNSVSEAYANVLVADVCETAGPDSTDISCNDIVISSPAFSKIGGDIVTGIVPEGVKWRKASGYGH
ncbi:hypothetical protein CF319_g4597 [Tilletia indica]|nr:hypothetical protein CF319_g4597 [Tilletia indica]